jgi:gliding motility-associated-like protein
MLRLKLLFIAILYFATPQDTIAQCNTNTTICTPGTAGPFNFQPASANPTGCLSFLTGSGSPNYAYIILYITQGGTLDLLINGNNTGPGAGCLDVQLFDITGQTNPCASLSPATEIGCNYVSPCDGCAEFGFSINGCPAQVAGPTVNAGDVIMILVEDFSSAQNSFTLDLGTATTSAQTGPPDATIDPVTTVCSTDASFQLTAVDNGGTWSGPGVNATGLFDPAAAGVGTHTIQYLIGTIPCDDQDQTTIEVIDCSSCNINNFTTNISACDPATNSYSASGVIEFTTPPTTGQLIVEDCNGNQQTFNAPFTSPTNYNLTGLAADGAACDVTAYFTDEITCTVNLGYTAPVCPCGITFLSTNISACDPVDNTFEITGSIVFQSPPNTGQLIVEDCNGNQQVFNAPFTSPQNYALTGINSDGTTNCDVTVSFTDDATCSMTSNLFDYPQNCFCGTDVGSFTDGVIGNANSTNPYLLCFNDQLNLTGNGDFIPPADFNISGTVYDPGVWMFVYSCPPTIFNPDDITTDPCYLGVASTNDQAWSLINNLGDNSTLYFVPITMYSMTDGVYAIVLNNGNLCFDMGPTYEVSFIQEIVTTIVEDCQAAETTVTISGGVPSFNGSNFTISNLQPATASLSTTQVPDGGSVVISGLVDGDNYSFDIVDNNGCPSSISGTFTGVEDATFNYNQQTYCQDEVDPLPNLIGDAGGTYSATGGLVINPNTGEIDLSSASGNFTITYTTSDPVCFSSETFDITINIIPIFNLASIDPTTCLSNDGTITLSGLDANTTFNITYSENGAQVGPNNMTSNAAGEIIISNLSPGAYSDFIVSLNGCSAVDNSTINLIGPNSPSVNAGSDIEVCEGDEVVLTANNPDGAVISWDNGVNDGTPFNPAVGTINYTVTANLAGCTVTDQVSVTVHPNPIVNAGSDLIICEGESVILTGSGADSYSWNNGVSDGVLFNPTTTQVYTLTGTTINGCEGTDEVTVEVESLPEVSFEADNFDGCVPVTVTFTNTSNVTGTDCTWNFGDGSTATGCSEVTHTFNDVGCFDISLEVISANGCTSSSIENDYICTSGYPNASFSLSPDELTTINTTVDFTNSSSGAIIYEWNFGDGQSSTDVNPSNTYPVVEDTFEVQLIAISASGCQDTAYAIVRIFEELVYYVPNTFTPDSDDYNETFKPVFTSGFDPLDYTLFIFNRWGEIIFESNNADIGWDGTYGTDSDRMVKEGTYVWKIIFKTKKSDERKVEVGHVNILK